MTIDWIRTLRGAALAAVATAVLGTYPALPRPGRHVP